MASRAERARSEAAGVFGEPSDARKLKSKTLHSLFNGKHIPVGREDVLLQRILPDVIKGKVQVAHDLAEEDRGLLCGVGGVLEQIHQTVLGQRGVGVAGLLLTALHQSQKVLPGKLSVVLVAGYAVSDEVGQGQLRLQLVAAHAAQVIGVAQGGRSRRGSRAQEVRGLADGLVMRTATAKGDVGAEVIVAIASTTVSVSASAVDLIDGGQRRLVHLLQVLVEGHSMEGQPVRADGRPQPTGVGDVEAGVQQSAVRPDKLHIGGWGVCVG
ncbi:hypothetical protein TYRP_012238 [Tyrophagus putrescentiae]|nr:hypothetical protein TYRP_012238 [Tyrophagus putrescentiae]